MSNEHKLDSVDHELKMYPLTESGSETCYARTSKSGTEKLGELSTSLWQVNYHTVSYP